MNIRISAVGIVFIFITVSWLVDWALLKPVRQWEYVRTTLLEVEFGERWPKVNRWKSPVSVQVFHKVRTHETLLKVAIQQLNNVFAGTNFYLKHSSNNALIFVHFEPFKDFIKEYGEDFCLTKEQAKLHAGAGCILFEDDGSIVSGSIWINPEFPQKYFYSILLEELTQVLGPVNDNAFVRNSLFFETSNGAPNRKTLSTLDKKLLVFLYKHLNPGDDEAAVRRAYDKYWDGIVVE